MAQSKYKWLILIIIVLLLANFAEIFFFTSKANQEKAVHDINARSYMTDFLRNDIGFTSQQMQRYDSLSGSHQDRIKDMMTAVRSTKEDLLKQISKSGFNDSTVDSISGAIADLRRPVELQLLKDLQDVRSLCTPEQRPKFDSLLYKVFERKNRDLK